MKNMSNILKRTLPYILLVGVLLSASLSVYNFVQRSKVELKLSIYWAELSLDTYNKKRKAYETRGWTWAAIGAICGGSFIALRLRRKKHTLPFLFSQNNQADP